MRLRCHPCMPDALCVCVCVCVWRRRVSTFATTVVDLSTENTLRWTVPLESNSVRRSVQYTRARVCVRVRVHDRGLCAHVSHRTT